jgi:hypothetical protein
MKQYNMHRQVPAYIDNRVRYQFGYHVRDYVWHKVNHQVGRRVLGQVRVHISYQIDNTSGNND